MSGIIHHKIYFKVAKEKLNSALDCEKSLISWMTDTCHWKKQDSIDQSYSELVEDSISSIIFSGLTVESFINYYGITRLSKSQFDNYLDKLDLLSKWIVIPKFITGKSIDTGSQSIEFLTKLIQSRNKLVHYKSSDNSIKDFYDMISSLQNNIQKQRPPWIKDAEISVLAIYKLLEDIIKIDSSITQEELEWKEEINNFFELWSVEDCTK
ncbi:hypothetical protein [Anabaena sp. CCY 9910]|uniref:hypothetical protein n=1 Tax=Anabaena sp. CCY 9910 TaxID=3103870 RepID=UPI0039E04155